MSKEERPIALDQARSRLRDICHELDGYAYMIGTKGDTEHAQRWNMEDISYGMGRILERIIGRIRKIEARLERTEVLRGRLDDLMLRQFDDEDSPSARRSKVDRPTVGFNNPAAGGES